MTEMTSDKPYTIQELQGLIDRWTGEIGESFVSYPLAKQLLVTMRREAKLLHAINMLGHDILSPKQRRRIAGEFVDVNHHARSEYPEINIDKES